MATDHEIARAVETVLRQSDPNSVTSLNGVVKRVEAELGGGVDLTDKVGFIRDQVSFLLRAHPQTHTSTFTAPRDHFAFQHSHEYQAAHYHHPHPHAALQHYPTHFALHPHHRPTELDFRQPHLTQSSPTLHSQSQPQSRPLPVQSPPQPQPQTHPPVTKAEVGEQNAVTAAPKASKQSGGKRRGGPGGLNKVCGVTPELQPIVGQPELPRTEIVKQLWAYIRKNKLQDPNNKRKIICDDALRVVFETDSTDMFKMNKLLAKHIIPLTPTKESGQAKRAKVVDPKTENSQNTESTQSSVVISEALAKFLGTEERDMLQSEALRLVWEYIKVNHLEDPMNSMVIMCDAKLTELLGCESISALGIPEMLARHHLFKRS